MYSSPEQLDPSQSLDRTTDIYALGVVLHNLITGRHPCYGEDQITYTFETKELFCEILPFELLTRVDDLNSFADSSGKLQNIIDKATEKNPDDRYQTCDEFLEALEELEE
jgi:serine/threonine-protein kinase